MVTGDQVYYGSHGLGSVETVTWHAEAKNLVSATEVYNFEVANTHTYFVGTTSGGVWVHNDCPVYRVLGGDARLYGKSWSPINTETVPNYRDAAGLPNGNTGQYLALGILKDDTGVINMLALTLDGNSGGISEFVVPDPAGQILVTSIEEAIPPY